MDKACGKVLVHKEPLGSPAHACELCGAPATVFLRVVKEKGREDWRPSCADHVSTIAGDAVYDLSYPMSKADRNQPDLPVEGEEEKGADNGKEEERGE